MADVVVNSDNKNPKELYAQGVRAYILQDFSSAVAALSQAIEMLVTEHKDDLHESLGDVYLYYGKSLLGLSRDESEALGDAVPRNNEESSEEDEIEEQPEGNENADNEAKESDLAEDDKQEKSVEPMESEPKETEPTTSNGTANEEPSCSNGTTAAEGEEEPTDLQVAWEVLELAKKIFQKQGSSAKKCLADTLTVLGEVSLESENFESAINDINEGLAIQKDIFAKDSRTVAETYYKLGIAYSTNSQIEEAVKSFDSSLEYLKNRIAHLEKQDDKKDEIEEEIKEIKSLIPDIQEKITDMKTYKDEALKKIVSAVTEGTKAEIAVPSSSSSKPATNISHLVKRKRKPEDVADDNQKQDPESSNPAKKVNSE
ncbi:unnamed protein product [Psylliodes chrysocephalus]|uniref:Tetratricopeptide SHNi-TPR domain-containing protein n=1 Tax=Psylliodes chrysocephalus TaxID=3402493 RepID=A0A9P0D1V6_9CUCU|nr:unnamed protein product [Psylliodes chrysocephala]